MNAPLRCLLATVESDSHTWNLIYLQKVLEEHGAVVRNLGCCTPVDELVTGVEHWHPDIVVVSTINGHGHHGVRVLLQRLRSVGLDVPVVVGGRLSTDTADDERIRRDLLQRGCADVFLGHGAVERFLSFLCEIHRSRVQSWCAGDSGSGRSDFGAPMTGDLTCTS